MLRALRIQCRATARYPRQTGTVLSDTPLTLLERLQRRPDAASWQRLVDIYAPLIRRRLSRTPIQPVDHDDLTQEVLKVVVQKLPDFERRREGSFRAWLRIVTANCLREYWRAAEKRPWQPATATFFRRSRS